MGEEAKESVFMYEAQLQITIIIMHHHRGIGEGNPECNYSGQLLHSVAQQQYQQNQTLIKELLRMLGYLVVRLRTRNAMLQLRLTELPWISSRLMRSYSQTGYYAKPRVQDVCPF